MTYIYIGQNYASQVGGSSPTSSGNPGIAGNGVNWPYDPNGNTPDPSQFQINWNAPNAMQQAEQAYEKLVNWLQNNPGCYNGYIMLLQMTTDIGSHLGQLPPNQRAQLAQFLSNQLESQDGSKTVTLLQRIISLAAEASAVSQKTEAEGAANAMAFLQQLASVTSALQGYGPPFSTMYNAAMDSEGKIDAWCQSSFKTFTDPLTGASSSGWVDSDGIPIASFSDFANMAAFSIGTLLDKSNVQQTINAYYQDEMQQIMAQFKGNPWALLVALMNLINQRDQDNGTAVNGYGNNLDVLKQANGLVQKLLGDISGTNPDAANFFQTLHQLKTLVEQDPALSTLVSQLQSDIGTINGQTVTDSGGTSLAWSVTAGYYNFPPNTKIYYNNQEIEVSGEVYLSGGQITINSVDFTSFTFGQLAAMGATSIIQSEMKGWSSTVMSNFENGVTGIQTLLNGASPAIQQQIQNTTQTMQAEENFEKEAFDSVVNVNQQIMKLVQQVMG